MTIPTPLQEALRDSITSGTFVDVKFWVFSKRRSNPGSIGGPKALFVNEHVAKRVPRLGALLDDRKTKENLRVRFPTEREPYTSGYDYDEDSDLEDDDEDASDLDDGPTAASQVAGGKSGNYPEPVAFEIPDAKSNDSQASDIISVSEFNSLFSESSDTKDETNPAPSAHVGKVIVIEDVAFTTFQALLRYLYTNEIEFAPWGSTERREARTRETVSEPYGIPKPSPKSVYRLADKYEIPELKELALRQIQQDLFKCDITEEVFSKYTSWYPKLRELELRQLARVLLSSEPGTTLASFKEKVKCYTHGKLPYGGHVISTLYELMESDESVKETPLAVAASVERVPGEEWAGLRRALISSLSSGTFLDSQFYAVESRSTTSSPKLRPIYFCSRVDKNLMSRLVTCSSKLGSQRTSLQGMDGYDSDIDVEKSDQEDSIERYPRFKCVRESPTPMDFPLDPALLLNHRAAKTWSAIFLYVYTGQITFAAISSRGVDLSKDDQNGHSEGEPKPLQDPEGLNSPLPPVAFTTFQPCSPKSVYFLANKVGLTGLCDIAFKSIRSNLDENNIIEELFSPFTAE
ncbi:hypothetical protein BJ322DRAFT_1103822 [Thelephora terrestris]|uniref:BTB domain-containing protein n=1 Tax=Thelephora terrestris TaxID=56493 RepID=A0A9P6LE90_9AGAM|nr:hypothetical protein BJ322DRAFT_1103822 [Thelephora terrestris]